MGRAAPTDSDGVYFVETEEQRRGVEELRYQWYVVDAHRYGASADHEQRRLKFPGDDQHRILFVQLDGEMVGTMRICHGALAPYTSEQMEAYTPDFLAPEVPLERTAVVDSLVVRADRRGGVTLMKLWFEAAEYALHSGVDLIFVDCRPHLLNLYRRVGWRSYRPNNASGDAGILIPLILNCHDLDYLEHVESPLLRALKRPGIRMPDRERGRRLRELIGDEAMVVGDEVGLMELWAQAFGAAKLDAPCDLFDGLDSERSQAVLAGGHILQVRRGEHIVRESKNDEALFVVLEGSVSAVQGGRVVRELGPGMVFGEMALFLGRRTADIVVSSEQARVLMLDDKTFKKLRRTDPPLAGDLMWNLCRILCTKVADVAPPEPPR